MIAPNPTKRQLETIADDFDFRHVIRRGSWEASQRFVSGRLEEIKDILRRRLHVRFGCENAIMPEGAAFIGAPDGKNKIEKYFVLGKDALLTEDYERAAAYFETSVRMATGVNQDIANNYRAYSLAKLGEPLRARLILSPLCKRQFVLPSAFWNLVCCMSPDQEEERLAVLAGAIYKAPHPLLLHGAVHLATILGHKLLSEWLLYLPFIEALLLSYCLKYDRMSAAEKETAMLRLSAYSFYGEPEVPDPLEYGVPPYKIKAFVNAMFERQKHADVVDFWLRCRTRLGQKRYGYWQTKADYLEQFGRRRRAINAFRSELHCRLNLLESAPRLQTNERFLSAIRMRAGFYLRRCMSSDLHNQGRAICHLLSRFEECYGIGLLPHNSQIRAFFYDDGAAPSKEIVASKEFFRGQRAHISPVSYH